jgi:hypothetical protein
VGGTQGIGFWVVFSGWVGHCWLLVPLDNVVANFVRGIAINVNLQKKMWPPVSLAPTLNLLTMSSILAMNLPTGVVDTGTTPIFAANIFLNFWRNPTAGIIRSLGKDDSWKKPEVKNLWSYQFETLWSYAVWIL